MLYLVPPMIIHLTNSKEILKKYDLSSVHGCFTGAAPLGQETAEELQRLFPKMDICQGYGLTETATVVCATVPGDIWFGSSGSLLPGVTARIVTPEGNEITGYDQPGELWVKAPSVTLGYLKNEQATKETFVEESDGRYMRTGDEAVVRKSPNGHEHVFIVDRIKE
jgi:acyl-CoA synthetase (AMP-forming)/AMP-acid ligase II